MTKIDIFSGFLGAGKTTLIKKLIKEAYKSEKLVLIENEFGQIGIDSAFMKEAEIEVTEMNSGCICCSLVGDFGEALKKVLDKFAPDRIIIEPSGVGKLSDVIKAVETSDLHDAHLNACVTVVDAQRCKMYMKNFGEFFANQIENAKCVILSHTQNLTDEKIDDAISLVRSLNSDSLLITTDWDSLSGKDIIHSVESNFTLKDELHHLSHEHHHKDCDCGHHHEHNHEHCDCHEHHHEHHNEDCDCGHHHEHNHEHCDCHEHHHEHHHEHCDCHEHHHEHHHEHCDCHELHHEHHHADEVFESYGKETSKKFTKEKIESILKSLSDEETYGIILRAKGVVESPSKEWIHFDYVPSSPDVRSGCAFVIGRICVIGKDINKENIEKLFEV